MKTISITLSFVWLLGAPGFAAPQNSHPGLSVKLGSAVTVQVTLKNTSEHDLYYGSGDFGDDIDVRDDKGEPVKTTKQGEVFKGRGDNFQRQPDGSFTFEVRGGGGRIFTLKPDESGTHEMAVSRYFEFQQPGKYAIQVTRIDPDTRTVVRSNVIKVTVLP
jgi:hypothetical protein